MTTSTNHPSPEGLYWLQNKATLHTDMYMTTESMYDHDSGVATNMPHWWVDFFTNWGPEWTFLAVGVGIGTYYLADYIWPHWDYCHEEALAWEKTGEPAALAKIEQPEDLWLHQKEWANTPYQTYEGIKKEHDREVKLYAWAWRRHHRRMKLHPPKPDEFVSKTFRDGYHENRLPEPLAPPPKLDRITIFEEQSKNQKEIQALVKKIAREELYLEDYPPTFGDRKVTEKPQVSQNPWLLRRIRKIEGRIRRREIGIYDAPRSHEDPDMSYNQWTSHESVEYGKRQPSTGSYYHIDSAETTSITSFEEASTHMGSIFSDITSGAEANAYTGEYITSSYGLEKKVKDKLEYHANDHSRAVSNSTYVGKLSIDADREHHAERNYFRRLDCGDFTDTSHSTDSIGHWKNKNIPLNMDSYMSRSDFSNNELDRYIKMKNDKYFDIDIE